MAKLWRYRVMGVSVIDQQAKDLKKMARALKDKTEESDLWQDRAIHARDETEADRAHRRMLELKADGEPGPGFRRTTVEEGAAYVRAAAAAGMDFRGTGVGFVVPVNFHLTRDSWVDWRSADYLTECPHCGEAL
jgi:hypothetical protein